MFDCDNIKRTAIAARNKPKILNRGESWFWMEKLLTTAESLPSSSLRKIPQLRDHVTDWRLLSCQRKLPDNESKKCKWGLM